MKKTPGDVIAYGMSVTGAVVFVLPIALIMFIVILAPMAGDLVFGLIWPFFICWGVGTITSLVGAVLGIRFLVKARRDPKFVVQIDGKKAKRSIVIGLLPTLFLLIALAIWAIPLLRS
jgi:hypothetical protein